MIGRAAIFDALRDELPAGARARLVDQEEVALRDLSIDSMGIINLLMALESRFGFDFGRLESFRPPRTSWQLAALVEAGIEASSQAGNGGSHDRLSDYRSE